MSEFSIVDSDDDDGIFDTSVDGSAYVVPEDLPLGDAVSSTSSHYEGEGSATHQRSSTSQTATTHTMSNSSRRSYPAGGYEEAMAVAARDEEARRADAGSAVPSYRPFGSSTTPQGAAPVRTTSMSDAEASAMDIEYRHHARNERTASTTTSGVHWNTDDDGANCRATDACTTQEDMSDSLAARGFSFKPQRGETIVHLLLICAMMSANVAFVHWHHEAMFLYFFGVCLFHLVIQYDVFHRRSGYNPTRNIIVIWVGWIVYGLTAFAFNVMISNPWVMCARDVLIFIPLTALFVKRFIPETWSQRNIGYIVGSYIARVSGNPHQRLERETRNVYESTMESLPQTVRHVADDTMGRLKAIFRPDCALLRSDLSENLGLRWFLPTTSFGFMLYRALTLIPFADNNPYSFNLYWTISRVVMFFVLYKLVDDIFRPYLVVDTPRSGIIVLVVSEFPLYVHPYMAVGAFVVFGVALLYIRHHVRAEANKQAHADSSTVNTMNEFA